MGRKKTINLCVKIKKRYSSTGLSGGELEVTGLLTVFQYARKSNNSFSKILKYRVTKCL
jgi:hypothetical protein